MPKSKNLKNQDCRGNPRYYKRTGKDTVVVHGLSRYWRGSPDMIDFESGPALFKGSDLLDGKKNLGTIKAMKVVHYETSEVLKISDKVIKLLKDEFDVIHEEKERTLKMNIMSAISSFLSDWVRVQVEMENKDGSDQK